MVTQVVWNKRAVERFDEIVLYLLENVSETSAEKFVQKTNDVIETLKKYPEIGRQSTVYKTVRQYKIDKFKRLYYRKQGSKLIIVYIYDDRQNPDLNPYNK